MGRLRLYNAGAGVVYETCVHTLAWCRESADTLAWLFPETVCVRLVDCLDGCSWRLR